MDWTLAAERNHEDLTRIVAGLILSAGLAAGARIERLKRPIYRAILRVLRPAESAVRRLIVYAGRNIVLEPPPARDHPVLKKKDKNKEKTKKSPGQPTGNPPPFNLFDPRKSIARTHREKKKKRPVPRVWSYENFMNARYEDVFPQKPKPADDGTVNAQSIINRLLAIKAALEDLPGQALRLAKLQARRARLIYPRPTSPIRYGPPPGYRTTRRKEIHQILDECHMLARDIIPDTS